MRDGPKSSCESPGLGITLFFLLAFKKDYWQVISPPPASMSTRNSSKLVKSTVRSPFLEPSCFLKLYITPNSKCVYWEDRLLFNFSFFEVPVSCFESNKQGANKMEFQLFLRTSYGRCGGLMVSALVSGSDDPGSSPGREHCVVFLGKILNAGGNPAMEWHPIQGVEILLVASCHRNWR